jgi:predicted small lipoprotein YifL
MKRSYLNALVILLVLSWACGRKGPVLPPLQKIPKSVEGASVVQVGL